MEKAVKRESRDERTGRRLARATSAGAGAEINAISIIYYRFFSVRRVKHLYTPMPCFYVTCHHLPHSTLAHCGTSRHARFRHTPSHRQHAAPGQRGVV